MCGFIGIIGNNSIVYNLYDGLIALQHRGQDSAGIITYNKQFHLKKDLGLVRDVFNDQDMLHLQGNLGLGHVRYATVGQVRVEDAQPFYVSAPYGIAIAHNGNLFNFWQLKQELLEKDNRHVNSNNDVEVILHIFAEGISRSRAKSIEKKIVDGVKMVYKRCQGAYSVVGIIAGHGLFAFRDPHGIKPIIFGERQNEFQKEYIISSEDVMYDQLNFKKVKDLQPGEMIFINNQRQIFNQIIESCDHNPCIFEYVYFARPDAMLDDVSVYRARLRLGQNLAQKIKKEYPHLKIDRVIPSPMTANTAAMALAHELNLRYSEGLVKNYYIGRYFIMPDQKSRKETIRLKLSTIDIEFKDRNVLIVDDSIVRGNTSRKIVKLAREAGAKKVYFASSSPPLRCPCLYGIDMPTKQEFIAHNLSVEEIRKSIGADILIYQDIEDMVEAVTRRGKHEFKRPCTACFNCQYPTCDVTEEILNKVEKERNREKDEQEKINTGKLL